jgi:hypothetical protein
VDGGRRFALHGLLPGRYRLEVLNTAVPGGGREAVYAQEIELAGDRTVAVDLAPR